MPAPVRRLFPLAVALGLLAGCGGGADGPVAVAGRVTLDGEPVGGEGGAVIRFTPAGPGRPSETVVRDGRYSLKLDRGDYKVAVNWPKSTGKRLRPDATGPGSDAMEMAEAVPAKFNTSTTLTAKVTGPASDLNFALSAK